MEIFFAPLEEEPNKEDIVAKLHKREDPKDREREEDKKYRLYDLKTNEVIFEIEVETAALAVMEFESYIEENDMEIRDGYFDNDVNEYMWTVEHK